MSQRIIPNTLTFGQLCLLEQISEREAAKTLPHKPFIRPEFLAGALLGLALGFAGSIHFLSTQANGLDAAARVPLYTPPSAQTASCR